MTDQQRYDSVHALGYPQMRTPHLDRLAEEGVSFDQCYCAAPSCVPSRASFFQLGFPHATGVLSNEDPWSWSWAELLQQAGYHTVNIGKMHTQPFDAPCGFDQRFVVENKDRKMRLFRPHGGFYDEWDKFLSNSGVRKPSRRSYREEYPGYENALGAYEWPLEERFHSDVFVGTMARWLIEQREAASPLFLQIGFPGPHPPYDPPARFIGMYRSVDFPVAEVAASELAGQPPPHEEYRRQMVAANHDAVRWKVDPTREELLRLRRYYAANVTLIDEQIGLILQTLRDGGYLEEAIVLFTSDHGDALGDHGHIQKWTMYDCIVRVPMILWSPRYLPAGRRIDELIQQMDVVPMLFELARVPLARRGDALSPLAILREGAPGREAVFAEQGPDKRLEGVRFETMIRTKAWKLVHYVDQEWGELYDLRDDPQEVRNLWYEAGHAEIRRDLLDRIRNWRIRSGAGLLDNRAPR